MLNLLIFLRNHILLKIYKRKNKTITIPDNFPLYSAKLSNYVHIEPDFHVIGRGKVLIGNNVIISRGFRGITSMHTPESDNNDLLPYNGDNDFIANIIIQNNVWIGSSVTVLAGITIEEGSVIGAGAVVTKDVKKGHVVAGVPARTIKVRNLEKYELLKLQNKLYLPTKYKKFGKV